MTEYNNSNDEIMQKMQKTNQAIQKLKEEIALRMVGQKEVIEYVIICLIADGQVLLEGVPGLGKTMLVRTLAEALDCHFSRIQFTPDLMPGDILGTTMIIEDEKGNKEFQFQKGPVFTNILLADEINRATPKTQAALLEAMQEKSVTIGNTTHQLEAPFFVLATQNPLEMEGTYPLPEAQLDRFLFKVNVPFPTKDELHEILERTTANKQQKINPVLDKSKIIELRKFARDIPVAKHVTDYALKIVLATHPELPEATPMVKQYLRFGASPRGAQAIILSAKILAMLDNRLNVSFDDIQKTALPALRHRCILNFEGEAENIATDDIIKDIIKKTPQTAR